MRFKSSAVRWFFVLFVITCALALIIPPSAHSLATLHISSLVYHLLLLTLFIPFGIVWFSAFYGYDQLWQYSLALPNTTEGEAFKKIANGLRILAWGYILSVILSLLLGAIYDVFPGFAPARTIIDNYVSLLIALTAFTLIGDGTNILLGFVKGSRGKTSVRALIILSCFVGVMFARSVVMNSNMNHNPYYLPTLTLLLTIVVPYIYTWVVGAIAAMDLRIYSRRIKGVLYRQALQKVASGLVGVILVSIIIQFIDSAFGNGQGLPVGFILLLDYILLAGQAVGYILIAVGAKRLKMIEEV